MKIAATCTLQMYGIFFIILGGVALFGYVFRIPFLTNFGDETAMSIPSAVGFVAVGISYFIIVQKINERTQNPWGSRNY